MKKKKLKAKVKKQGKAIKAIAKVVDLLMFLSEYEEGPRVTYREAVYN